MNQYTKNIRTVFDMASIENKKRGKEWYIAARIAAFQISQQTGVPLITVCGVIAALSPRNKWARNLLDAEQICRSNEFHKCATFKANVHKAIRIMGTSDKTAITAILSGKKITAFFDNIYDPSSSRVTVDVHMQLVALGSYLKEKDRPSLTDKMYREIEEAVKEVAIKNGLQPFELQAITWLTWKERTK